MIKRVVYIFAFMVSCSVFGQSFEKHKVEKGETITQIAQKYNVTPYDIYQLNPDSQSGLKPNTVLLIPKKGSTSKVVAANTTQTKVQNGTQKVGDGKTHKVEPKETLFGIEKKYGVSDEDLKRANPDLEKLGLQIGQVLNIPSKKEAKEAKKEDKKEAVKVASTAEKAIYHDVLPKETKYSIAKKYGITIQEMEKRNPEVVLNLPIGYRLLIKGTPSKTDKVLAADSKKEASKATVPTLNYVDYTVKPKETLYSLSKMSGLSQDELIKLNPDLNNGVEIGMILKVPSTATITEETKEESKKEYATLSKKRGAKNKKQLVLLMPFNLSKIDGDSINSITTRLKKDKFLNMTLDFYSGALMAIDSAKTLGINVDVNIIDSQETKNTSSVSLNNVENADAVVGPFYQSNVEKTAGLLTENNVPIISPLSKDIGNAYPNLYQTIPTTETLRSTMFDYMRNQGGNIIAVVDKKKESSIQYIKENQKDVKFAPLLDNGNVSVEGLKMLFVKDRINYVVLETANTIMIKWTINAMISSMKNYKVQLVILEPNETLDTDEISFDNLIKLKLMYPSINRENDSDEALIFEKEYRKKNKIAPSNFATRGFDVTFDTMMRLAQDKSFQETVDSIATEQVDNKFEYYKKEDGGYTNKGVYILYYDSDLTIKEAK